MTTSPGQQPRDQVAPPRESAGRLHRTGYLALAASGLALCTAFAAVAQIVQPETTGNTQTTQPGRSSGGGEPAEIVPGQAEPAETTVVIDGVAVTGSISATSETPTTVITTDENGTRHTTVHTPSPSQPTRSSDNGGGGSTKPEPTDPTDDPGPNPTDPPEPSDSAPSEPDPEPDPTDPEPEPSTPNPSDGTSPPAGSSSPAGAPSPTSTRSDSPAPSAPSSTEQRSDTSTTGATSTAQPSGTTTSTS